MYLTSISSSSLFSLFFLSPDPHPQLAERLSQVSFSKRVDIRKRRNFLSLSLFSLFPNTIFILVSRSKGHSLPIFSLSFTENLFRPLDIEPVTQVFPLFSQERVRESEREKEEEEEKKFEEPVHHLHPHSWRHASNCAIHVTWSKGRAVAVFELEITVA